MTSIEVKNLLSGKAAELNGTVEFGVTKDDNFNIADHVYPAMNINPLNYNISFANDQLHREYPIQGSMYVLSGIDDLPDKLITDVDPLETLFDEFIVKLNEEDLVTVSGIQVTKFEKVLDDCISGILFRFTLVVPRSYNYCA
jgi:hypothetical protein